MAEHDKEYSTRICVEAGAEAQTHERLPKEIAAGVWVD